MVRKRHQKRKQGGASTRRFNVPLCVELKPGGGCPRSGVRTDRLQINLGSAGQATRKAITVWQREGIIDATSVNQVTQTGSAERAKRRPRMEQVK